MCINIWKPKDILTQPCWGAFDYITRTHNRHESVTPYRYILRVTLSVIDPFTRKQDISLSNCTLCHVCNDYATADLRGLEIRVFHVFGDLCDGLDGNVVTRIIPHLIKQLRTKVQQLLLCWSRRLPWEWPEEPLPL